MSFFVTLYGTKEQKEELKDTLPCSLDDLVVKCQMTLYMVPDNLHIDLFIHGSIEDVQEAYFKRYGVHCDYEMWMSKSTGQVHISLPKKGFWSFFAPVDSWLEKLCHEIGHVIVEAYYTEETPYPIHELMAQYCAFNTKI